MFEAIYSRVEALRRTRSLSRRGSRGGPVTQGRRLALEPLEARALLSATGHEQIWLQYWTPDESQREEIRAIVSATVANRVFDPNYLGGSVAMHEVLDLPEGMSADDAIAQLYAKTNLVWMVSRYTPPPPLPPCDPPPTYHGPAFVPNRLSVQFRANVTQSEKDEVRTLVGGQLVSTNDPIPGNYSWSDGGVDVIEMPNEGLVDDAIARVQHHSAVKSVERIPAAWLEDWGTIDPVGGGAVNVDSVGLFDPTKAEFLASNQNTTGFADDYIQFGKPGGNSIAILGDWNGDGTETPGQYDPQTSLFWLSDNHSGFASYVFGFGVPGAGWKPIVGDWEGDGKDTVGLYDSATAHFYLRNSLTAGYADQDLGFGTPGRGQQAVIGDWDGDGVDSVGIFDPQLATFALRNSNTTGFGEVQFSYGAAGNVQRAVAGDWNADGRDTVGLYVPSTSQFLLRNSNSTGFADITAGFGVPDAGYQPVVGDWDGSSTWAAPKRRRNPLDASFAQVSDWRS